MFRHLLPVLFLVLPVFVFHFNILVLNGVICGGDMINQFVPWREYAFTELKAGRFPIWNPFVFCGTPFAANIQTSLFYPFNLVALLCSVERTFSLSLVFHQVLACLGMYCFVYGIINHKGGAVIAGLVYGWSGFLVTHGYDGHLIHIRAYAFLPFALLFQSLWRLRQRPVYLLFLAMSVSLMFYGGHIQVPFYLFYLLLARAVWWGCWESQKIRSIVRYALGTSFAIVWSIGLSALVLVPLVELSKETAGRAGGADYRFATNDSMPPGHIVTMLAPLFYGDPTAGDADNRFWETRTGYHEICGYTGILALLLVPFIFLPEVRSARMESSAFHRESLFFLVLILVSFIMAMGRFTPFYSILYYGFPGWSYFRVPGRLLLLTIVGISVCSGIGFAKWMNLAWKEAIKTWPVKYSIVASVLFGIAVSIVYASKPSILMALREFEIDRTIMEYQLWNAFRGDISARLPEHLFETRFSWMFFSLTLALFLLGLSWFALWFASSTSGWYRWLAPGAVLLFDIAMFSYRFNNTIEAGRWRETYFPRSALVDFLQQNTLGYRILCLDDAIGHPGLNHHPELRPNRLMAYGIETVRGYDPIILKSYTRYINTIFNQDPDTPQGGLLFFPSVPDGESIDRMNVRYILTTQDLTGEYTVAWQPPGSPLKVYENPTVLPKAFLVEPQATGSVTIVKQLPNRVEIEVESSRPATLVYSNNFYHGWRVAIDSSWRQPDAYANTFLATTIPAGKHKVVFAISPWSGSLISSFALGGGITLLAALASIGFVIIDFKKYSRTIKS